MDIDVITEEENPMLHRTDVRFEVRHDDATPSRLSVRDSLAAQLNKDAEEVVVRELDTKFGMRKTVGHAKVYDGPGFAQEVEQDHMLQRNKIVTDGEGATTVEAPAQSGSESDLEPEDDESADEDGATEGSEAEAADAEDDDVDGGDPDEADAGESDAEDDDVSETDAGDDDADPDDETDEE